MLFFSIFKSLPVFRTFCKGFQVNILAKINRNYFYLRIFGPLISLILAHFTVFVNRDKLSI